MNDFYLKAANTSVGKSIFEALNLPKPPVLKRSPDTCLSTPTGRVLIAGTKNNYALDTLHKFLDLDSLELCTPQIDAKAYINVAVLKQSRAKNAVTNIDIEQGSHTKFNALVFDATGFEQLADADTMYRFFHHAIGRLKRNGRVLIIGRHLGSANKPYEAALAESLTGFVKSLAKEIGRKGATCNLIQLEKGAEQKLQAPVFYFLGTKSAFVSGQSLTVCKSGAGRKTHWALPLKGKTAVVTGAAQGIGEETARVLARDGATVVCLDIPANKAKLSRLADEIGGHAVCLDLGDADAPEQLATLLGAQLGVIDIIVHNAGITRDKTLAKMPQHFWDQVMDINLNKIIQINDTLMASKVLAPKGRIVCVSSISGIAGNFGQTNYACSKAGIAGYTRFISETLESDITINAVAPGFIETKMTSQIPFMTREIGRRTSSLSQGGLPLDVAEAISLFCHPAAQGLNGNVLRVCGQSLLGR